MRLFSLEHSRAGYLADFWLFGTTVVALSGLLVMAPIAQLPSSLVFIATGGTIWTLFEYALHRFLMHGVQPVRGWHAEHHRRPMALLGSPTLLTALVLFALVYLPVQSLTDARRAAAFTIGFLIGYLLYGAMHHAIHHWSNDNPWLRERKRWHALHHQLGRPVCFGVTSGFWDHVFGTAPTVGADAFRSSKVNE
jgi:cyclopropane-fatty-acyl-phospholipid synthase